MIILAADTSTKIISIALMDNGKIKTKLHRPYSRSQGSSIIPAVKKLLDKTCYNIKDIDLFCIGLGPGSFTGLRASLASMCSLSIALKKPIIGIPSFDAIAYNVSEYRVQSTEYREIVVMADARQNKVYARFYKKSKGTIEPVSDFILDTLENIIKYIKNPTIVLGDAVNAYKSRLDVFKNKIDIIAEQKLWHPKAGILAKLADAKYKKGYKDDPFKILPLYVYPKECQIKSHKSQVISHKQDAKFKK